jgi:hypothetical protein
MKKTCTIILMILVLPNIVLARRASEVVTNPFRADGFGAQFQSIIHTVIYAELNDKKFVYTPFRGMEHNYENEPDFLEKKERFINFIGNFEVNNVFSIQPRLTNEMNKFFEDNLSRGANSCSLKRIKEVFRLNKDYKNFFKNENLNIAVHVRRPNPHDTRPEGCDIPDKVYLKIIDYLRDIYAWRRPLFHIYSQGDYKTFEGCFNASDMVCHINGSVEETFSSMVFADVLVTSASSLSYVAGMLSDGVVYYIPFWHSPLPHWKVLDHSILKRN